MGNDSIAVDEINELIRVVDERVVALELELETLDSFENAEARRAIETRLRDLKDQHRLLVARWNELTKGFFG